jgi:hypothetical protein
VSVTSVPAEIVGDRTDGPTPTEMPSVMVSVQRNTRPALRIRRCLPEEGPAFWRWDCSRCGEYGGGRHHFDAVARAMRHCTEHPEHRSSLLPPVRCRAPEGRLAVHPMLFAVDDDPPPVPLSI